MTIRIELRKRQFTIYRQDRQDRHPFGVNQLIFFWGKI